MLSIDFTSCAIGELDIGRRHQHLIADLETVGRDIDDGNAIAAVPGQSPAGLEAEPAGRA